jgi:GH24 family phage-related lysozyme (muramidase)
MRREVSIGLSRGYGHDIPTEKELARITKLYGSELDNAEAWSLLESDLGAHAKEIARRLEGVKLTQSEFDALVSQSFNGALYKKGKSETLDALKAGKARDEVAALMLTAITSEEPEHKGKGAVQGLVERRLEEIQIFLGGGYPSRSTTSVSGIARDVVKQYNEEVRMADPMERASRLAQLQRRVVPLARKGGLVP